MSASATTVHCPGEIWKGKKSPSSCINVQRGRQRAVAKSSTYGLVIQSCTQWMISSMQEMWKKSLECSMGGTKYSMAAWHHWYLLWNSLFLTEFKFFANNVLIKLSYKDFLQYEAFNKVSFPALHMFCISAYLKALELNRFEKKKQYSHNSTSALRPQYPIYPLPLWDLVPSIKSSYLW